MANNNDVFDAFRCCITDQKCNDCPHEDICNILHNGKAYVQIPKVLALNVLEELKSLRNELDKAYDTLNEKTAKWYRCKECGCGMYSLSGNPVVGECPRCRKEVEWYEERH